MKPSFFSSPRVFSAMLGSGCCARAGGGETATASESATAAAPAKRRVIDPPEVDGAGTERGRYPRRCGAGKIEKSSHPEDQRTGERNYFLRYASVLSSQ